MPYLGLTYIYTYWGLEFCWKLESVIRGDWNFFYLHAMVFSPPQPARIQPPFSLSDSISWLIGQEGRDFVIFKNWAKRRISLPLSPLLYLYTCLSILLWMYLSLSTSSLSTLVWSVVRKPWPPSDAHQNRWKTAGPFQTSACVLIRDILLCDRWWEFPFHLAPMLASVLKTPVLYEWFSWDSLLWIREELVWEIKVIKSGERKEQMEAESEISRNPKRYTDT